MIAGVLVLAAGKSTRIAERSRGLPKPLLEIGAKPVVGYTLEWLAGYGMRTVWMNLHYQPEVMRRALGDGSEFGVRLRYSFEPQILGTAGAWKKLHSEWNGTSLVIYGDNLMRFDMRRFVAAHESGGALMTLAVFDPTLHRHTGIAGGIALLSEHGRRVERFVEGTPPDTGRAFVNAGAYLLEPDVSRWIPGGFQDFGRDVLPGLASAGMLGAHVLERGAFCLGLDTPSSLERGEELVRAGSVSLR
jgi:NDP-sugar pyrophosphorylase family protein